jgi:hypothetical protein
MRRCGVGAGHFPGYAMLIHEWLHRAGQLEDLTSTAGPGDPPTSDQIQAMVEEACNDPQVIE